MAKYYETLSKVEQAKLVSAVKRLNERMRDLERRGLQGSQAYQNLSSWVANMPNKIDKTGTVRAVQTYKLTPAQARRTMAISNNKNATAGAEIKRAKEFFREIGIKPTEEEIKRNISQRGDLHEFIVNNTQAYYGTELHTAVKRSTKLTAEEENEFYKLMSKVDPVDENRNTYEKWLKSQEWV